MIQSRANAIDFPLLNDRPRIDTTMMIEKGNRTGQYAWIAGAVLIAVFGCTADEPVADRDMPPVTSNTQTDISHEHKHIHDANQSHEHVHEKEVEGTHSHEHEHGHRHGDPLFGGRIIAIGHSHHNERSEHYHLEVMPITDGRLTIHVLVSSQDGVLAQHPIKATELEAQMQMEGGDDRVGYPLTFLASSADQSSSEFTAVLPAERAGGQRFSVVIPSVPLTDRQQSVSFETGRD